VQTYHSLFGDHFAHYTITIAWWNKFPKKLIFRVFNVALTHSLIGTYVIDSWDLSAMKDCLLTSATVPKSNEHLEIYGFITVYFEQSHWKQHSKYEDVYRLFLDKIVPVVAMLKYGV
jgi:hypothetical protein